VSLIEKIVAVFVTIVVIILVTPVGNKIIDIILSKIPKDAASIIVGLSIYVVIVAVLIAYIIRHHQSS